MANEPSHKVLADGTEVIRTCAWSPPGCHPTGCGLLLYVKDGKLVKVEGDPDHPVTKGKLCVRCLTLPEYIYHPDRLMYPMKRAKEFRGMDKWERCTWEEAWAIIKENTDRIRAEFGSQSIAYFGGTGREAIDYNYNMTNHAVGTPNNCYTQSGWSCYAPRCSITATVFGTAYPELDNAGAQPLRYDDPEYVLPAYILMWGKEPLKSNPDGFFGHSVIELMKRGTKLICVDPRVHWLGSRAEMVIQLRPGTDAALAMAMLNEVIVNDLYDHEFVNLWCYGFDQLAERVSQMPAEKAAEVCGVPVEQIRQAAKILGTAKPWALSWGLALDQNPNGAQASHCILSLAALTGNLDIPGGTTLGVPIEAYPNSFKREMIDETANLNDSLNPAMEAVIPPEMQDMKIGNDEYPYVIDLVHTPQPDMILECLETGKPYPLKLAWIGHTNLLAPTNSAQPKRWHDALRKIDFCVGQDTFMTPTIMALADVVLPMSTFAEHDGVVQPQYGANLSFVGAINKAITVGECKSDLEVLLECRRVLWPGMDTPTIEAYLDEKASRYGMTFKELSDVVTYQPGQIYKKYEKGLLRRDGQPGFETASGRIELYSLGFERYGEDPLPYFEEPRWSQNSHPELAKEFPLILTTGARNYTSFHSEHRHIKSLREIEECCKVDIHPETAAELGIQEGDWVIIENMFGKAGAKARIRPTQRKDTVAATHGWWYPEEDAEEPSLFGVWKSNVNELIPHKEIGKLGFGAPYKSIMCKVYKDER